MAQVWNMDTQELEEVEDDPDIEDPRDLVFMEALWKTGRSPGAQNGMFKAIRLYAEEPEAEDPENAVRWFAGMNAVPFDTLRWHVHRALLYKPTDERMMLLARSFLFAATVTRVVWIRGKATRCVMVPAAKHFSVSNITITEENEPQSGGGGGICVSGQAVPGPYAQDIEERDIYTSKTLTSSNLKSKSNVSNAINSGTPHSRSPAAERVARHRARLKAEAVPADVKAERDRFVAGQSETYLGHDRAFWSTVSADLLWFAGLDAIQPMESQP